MARAQTVEPFPPGPRRACSRGGRVDALYRDGVFKPLQDVDLPENQRVRLSVQRIEAGDVQARLARIEEIRVYE